MTDTAIPIPDDAQARLEAFTAAWQPLIDDLTRGIEAAGRVLQRSMEASAQRWRVNATMPALDMRAVMVHGLVPYTREEA
ncbi:hypothetical protein NGM33_28820 [Nocardiopsis dassonvillei]|uniref:hypothetical protein n=1 Tax=Nocardiopsis dassonvillei TaxID=2014 RepID=UPI0020A43858|nr:hypothetical protein [Nocardiopsis dassonvillei]MCP3017341.1 hypothetical protein [Nocardiopsis dassonvillei]